MNFKRILITLFSLCCIITLLGIGGIWYFMHTITVAKKTNPFVMHWEHKFHYEGQRPFMRNAFEKLPEVTTKQHALIIGADLAEKDTVLPLRKGYHLIAFDGVMSFYELMIPEYQKYKHMITVDQNLKWKWNYDALPQLDLVMASFILSFYNKEKFKKIWSTIETKTKSGCYFIGNFYAPDFTYFNEDIRSNMTLLTKPDVKALLKNWRILDLKEITQASPVGNGNEHYFEVFAQKL